MLKQTQNANPPYTIINKMNFISYNKKMVFDKLSNFNFQAAVWKSFKRFLRNT